MQVYNINNLVYTRKQINAQIKDQHMGEPPTSFAELDSMNTVWQSRAQLVDLDQQYDFLRQNIIAMESEIVNTIDMLEALAMEYGEKLDSIKDRVQKSASSLTLFKDLQGNYRWYAWVTNKYLDRDGEILSDASHKEFANYLDDNPDEAPELWTWHTPGTARNNKADWWNYNGESGIFSFSGILTEKEYEEMSNRTSFGDLGVSHGFFVLDREDNVIDRYRTFEISELPLKYAANPYTAITTITETRGDVMNPDKWQFLVERFGEETARALVDKEMTLGQALDSSGLSWKEFKSQYEDEFEQEEAATVAKEETTEVVEEDATEEDLQEVDQQVVDSEDAEVKEADAHEEDNEADEVEATEDSMQVSVEQVTEIIGTQISELREAIVKDLAKTLVEKTIEIVNVEELMTELADIKQRLDNMEEQQKQLTEVKEDIVDLQKSQDARVAEMFLSDFMKTDWNNSVQSDKNKKAKESNEDLATEEEVLKEVANTWAQSTFGDAFNV